MLDININYKQGSFKLNTQIKIDSKSIGLFGSSGSGKTTILHLISGLKTPDSGYIKLNNNLLFSSLDKINIPVYKRKIGYIFQDHQLFPHLSVKNNLLYGYKNIEKSDIKFSFEKIIDLLEIKNLLNRKVNVLSGGEKQRIAIGRAILSSPDILLMDEPLSSLDSNLKKQILPFFRKIIHEINIPVLYVSHSINEILQLTSDVIFIDKGEIISYGNFFEAINNEKALNLSKNSGYRNILKVEIIESNIEEELTIVKIDTQNIKLPYSDNKKGNTVLVSIGAEDIALSKNLIQGTSIQNQIKGIVKEIKHVGKHALLIIDIGIDIIAEISLKSLNELQIKKNCNIYCLIKSSSFTYLN